MMVQKLAEKGVHLKLNGEKLAYEIAGKITDEQLQFLKQNKSQLVAELKAITNNVIDLIPFLKVCCHGLNTSSEEVKQKLLNQGNIEDIINGDIPAKTIQAHIQLWIVEGKKDISGNKNGN